MSWRVNTGSSDLWQKVHLVQPHSFACPCVCLPPRPFFPCCSPSCQVPHPGIEPVCSSTFSPPLSFCLQPTAFLPVGCFSNESWSCRKDPAQPLQHPSAQTSSASRRSRGNLEPPQWERGPSVASAPGFPGGTHAGSSVWPIATSKQLLLGLCWHDPA